jgi:hypothetical protein
LSGAGKLEKISPEEESVTCDRGRLDAALRSCGKDAAAGSPQEAVSFAGREPNLNGT